MLLVYKSVFQPEQVMVIVLIQFAVQLRVCEWRSRYLIVWAYQIEDRNLHHTLIEIGCSVLYYLHSDDLLCFEVLAFDDLTECTLTQHVQDQIPVPGLRQ